MCSKVVQELEEEKCKHEHDTAQGDDITYGLEKDRTRLKQVSDCSLGVPSFEVADHRHSV